MRTTDLYLKSLMENQEQNEDEKIREMCAVMVKKLEHIENLLSDIAGAGEGVQSSDYDAR